MSSDTPLALSARTPAMRQYIQDLLLEICRIDTTPRADLDSLRLAEDAVFQVLEREASSFALPGFRSQRKPIRPEIQQHPFYSRPYYAISQQRKTITAADAYGGRCNLLFFVGGEAPGPAVNAHIDVVQPYIPPRVEDGIVYGRGACDDKGPVVALMAALKLIGEHCRATGAVLHRGITAMLVIDEEMGGNGSLSLAIDRELKKRYENLLVLECTGSRLHPGNRGALWYKLEANVPAGSLNCFEASAFIVEEMEKEGRALRAESDHELFPHRPVQTCHGIIGPFGEHPSRINGRVDFAICFASPLANAQRVNRLITDVIEFAVAEYVGVYGDKTKVMDSTGKPKVDHHYDLVPGPDGFVVQIHGSTGHMGSILQNDCAITKMASIVRAILRSRAAIESAAGARMTMNLLGQESTDSLVMEGGQGFLPTHDMPQVMRRITAAVHRGARNYARFIGADDSGIEQAFRVSFEKLHNAAFAGRPDSPEMLCAIDAAKSAGIWQDQPIRGWDVSCDSRIFACEYPQMTVLTGGPGQLVHAHSDNEQCRIDDIAGFADFLAHYLMRLAGTISQITGKASVNG